MKLKILLALLPVVVWGERPNLLGSGYQEYGASLVCHTFLNSMQHGYLGDPEGLARDRFWGWQGDTSTAPAWVLPVVAECIRTHAEHDPTDGAIFLFSLQDMIDNRWFWHKATARAGVGAFGFFTFRHLPDPWPEAPILAQ